MRASKLSSRRQDLIDLAAELGIQIKVAKESDRNAIGIHLLHPDLEALEDALQVAERDMFPAIYIHRGNPRSFSQSLIKTVEGK